METIHDAARAGDVATVLSFLDTDALSLNARDRHSRTPYPARPLPASWAGQADVVHTLCEKHADVGASAADDMAAIHFASQKGHAQVVRYLLAAGAFVNARTRKGMTPLHYAVQGGHLDVAMLLIKKGGDLHTLNKAGKKAIDLAKDEEFWHKVLAAESERKEAKAADKKAKSEDRAMMPVSGNGPDPGMTEEKDGQLEDQQSQKNDVSPPRKKIKVQLSHLGTDQESDLQDAEGSGQ